MQGQVPAKPGPNVYTALLLVAIIALAVTIGFSMHHLMSSPQNGGYGLAIGDLFAPVEVAK